MTVPEQIYSVCVGGKLGSVLEEQIFWCGGGKLGAASFFDFGHDLFLRHALKYRAEKAEPFSHILARVRGKLLLRRLDVLVTEHVDLC